MVVETEQRIAQVTEKFFGVEIKASPEENGQNGELQPLKFAEKCSQLLSVKNNGRWETVTHFFTRVRTPYGAVLKFNDAGSRAVRIRTDWRVTETKNNPALSLGKST